MLIVKMGTLIEFCYTAKDAKTNRSVIVDMDMIVTVEFIDKIGF